MDTANIHEAKTHLSQLIERVERGEEIIIARAGKPVAKLVPYEQEFNPRVGGQWAGKASIGPDFDELPKELAEAFGMLDVPKNVPS